MVNALEEYPIHNVLSLKPLVEYLNKTRASFGSAKTSQLDELNAAIEKTPELLEPIEDLSLLEEWSDIVQSLMDLVFPPMYWESEAVAAVLPFSMKPIFVSPRFRQLFLDKNGSFIGRWNVNEEDFNNGRAVRAYLFILEKYYDFQHKFDYPLLHIVPDPETGLDRYFRIRFNFRFVDVHAVKEPKKLTEEERSLIQRHIIEPQVLKNIISPLDFELRGLTLFHAVDVTEFEIMSEVERDLIGHESIIAQDNLFCLQQNLRVLFRRSDLVVGLDAIKGNKILQIGQGRETEGCCIFTDSHHVPISEIEGTIYEDVLCRKDIMMIPDITKEQLFDHEIADHIKAGCRSLLIAPLHYEEQCIGLLYIGSPTPEDLGPMDILLLSHILPFFSMAVKRALDELDHRIQGIIKEKCTAIHPIVEWRFREAAFRHLEDLQMDRASEIEPIVFKGVYPLYGISDIRGSANERNQAIQKDLAQHLNLALDIVLHAIESKQMMILQELAERIQIYLKRIRKGLGTGDELEIIKFLRDEVERIFPLLQRYGLKVIHAIEKYETTMDLKTGTVYRLRKDFEDSVATLNDRLTLYLDREEAEAQEIFPHFFERHRSDGLDYLIYIGASLLEDAEFNEFYLKDLRLWQLKVACGMAWHTEQLKSELKVPLDTTHLILVQDTPISIRFRYDEKRFDVDGAYDIRQEIIKSRIDKATIKDTKERLTMPGKIAIVYSHPEEAVEMHRHINFLNSDGYLTGETEELELAELPGVRGLKSLRIDVDLKSKALSERSGFTAV